MSSATLLRDCPSPEPLHSGYEYKLCPIGFVLNLEHAEAQSRAEAANAKLNNTSDPLTLLDRFEDLKLAVGEKHNAIAAQIDHVNDCFVCSVAFGLTPEVKETSREQFTRLLAKFGRVMTMFM